MGALSAAAARCRLHLSAPGLATLACLPHPIHTSGQTTLPAPANQPTNRPTAVLQYSPDLRDLAKSLLSKSPKLRPSPDQILKLPWLKEYVSRAREKVARMEQSPSRRALSVGRE